MYRLLLTILLSLLLTNNGFTQTWNPVKPANGDNPVNYPTDSQNNNNAVQRLLFNYRQGANLIYANASSLTINAGEVACNSVSPIVISQNTSSVTATTANLDTGNSFSASTTYYVYASCTTSPTTFTVVLSLNSTTPTGVTNYKILGNFTTDSSSNIANIVDNAVVAHFGANVTSYSVNTVYQAATDLFVSGALSSFGATGIVSCVTDNNPAPTTVWGTANVNTGNGSLQCFMPVRKGDYWKVTETGAGAVAVLAKIIGQ